MTALRKILAQYRATSQTEREKGSYFEELIRTYFRYEASYADLYSDVWTFADWAKEIGTPDFGISAKDTGIDLVARTAGTSDYHAIQCKFYDPDYRLRKEDIDSFFTASGRKPFTQRIIVSSRIQHLLKDENNQLKVDDAARIIGCWKALSKQGAAQDLAHDPDPMRRAVAFCQVIERQQGAKTHKVSSKQIASMFKAVVEEYQKQEDSDNDLLCEAAHVDGSMNAAQKEEKLTWLKAEPPANTCRILSNVRCLSEGVDVPALDAVLFLTPRNSPVDVVQSVGRVMRNAPGKKLGYVILPVVIPHGMEAHDALDHNQVYKVVWDVLQALRSHDDRFDAFVNKLDLIGRDQRKMEVIHITDQLAKKSKATPADKKTDTGKGKNRLGETGGDPAPTATQMNLQFQVGEIERALYAKVVKKCGNRNHWEDWANDIAKIAQTHIARITAIVSDPANQKECAAFQAFAHELRDDLNDSITDSEVIEMLAQHLITKPVFDALFADYSFASHNPVSQAMQGVLDVLQEHSLKKEADTLEKFYASVASRAEGIDNAEGKQKIVVELYDKFFRNAFPKMTERLGIVYTPVEVVDFIIHSINDLLQSEFGQTLGSKGVHIIDPFTGTGTFITRLLQSGLIKPEELPHKYKHEIHANEIVLLAYYIAAINIEAVYHSSSLSSAITQSSQQHQAHGSDEALRDRSPALRSAEHYRVEKMKFAKTRDPETNKSINDRRSVIYNDYITLRDIPLEAYDYVVNGKPALEWVMERQSVTTDKDSGITNDANLWATETMNNPRYPLELFLRVITVSLETMKIVTGLPKLDI